MVATAWYVLRSKPFKEEFLWGQMLAHQIEVFYPAIQAAAFSAHARKTKPYFPGHLFIHLDLEHIQSDFLNQVPGSLGLIVLNQRPLRLPDYMIGAIRLRLECVNRETVRRTADRQPVRAPSILEDAADCIAIFDNCGSGVERVRTLVKLLREMEAV